MILVSPWQLHFTNRMFMAAFNNLLALGIVIPASFAVWRFLAPKIRSKLLSKVFVLVSFIALGVLVIANLFWPHVKTGTYIELYTNPNNEHETIEVIWNHRIMNWNELKHIVRFPATGMSLTKDFEPSDLNGEWIVMEDNPYHEQKGLMTFEHGVVIEHDKKD